MLEGDFFVITTLDASEGVINAELEIDAKHRIFEGHFPGQPVVPGVCMIQMIKEIIEETLNKKIRLTHADHAKFLAIIDPRVDPEINATIKYTSAQNGQIDVTASLFKDKKVFFKLKATMSKCEDVEI